MGGGQHLALTVGWRMCTQRKENLRIFRDAADQNLPVTNFLR
jgi:hypothetical protein